MTSEQLFVTGYSLVLLQSYTMEPDGFFFRSRRSVGQRGVGARGSFGSSLVHTLGPLNTPIQSEAVFVLRLTLVRDWARKPLGSRVVEL